MITRIGIQNYKALRDVSLELTPIHVLIGPNDSGKTSILEAIAALCRSVDHPLSEAFTGSWEGSQLVWGGKRNLPICLTATIKEQNEVLEYYLECTCSPKGKSIRVEAERVQHASDSQPLNLEVKGETRTTVCRVASEGRNPPDRLLELTSLVYESLRGVETYRLDGRYLALPVAPDAKRRRMGPSGFGLASLLDDILGDDRSLFMHMEERFKSIFPAVNSIKLVLESAYKSPVDDAEQIPMLKPSDGKGLYFELKGIGQPISARQMSDGVLLVLAYLAVLHVPDPPRVLLFEEPENGIYPMRLREVMAILRDLVGEQSRTQVVLTTHSPYVVDLFSPEEVTLCQKEDDGSVSVHRLSESDAVRQQMSVFTLGEIWTAEGEQSLIEPAAL